MANTPDTAGPEGAAKALAGAKDALAKGSKFTQSVEGNSTSSFAPPAPPKEVPGVSKYHVARTARSAGGSEPIGGMTGAEGKTALESHDNAMKALHPDQ
jgi:hypothetical protein